MADYAPSALQGHSENAQFAGSMRLKVFEMKNG